MNLCHLTPHITPCFRIGLMPDGLERTAQTVLSVYLNRTCSRVTSAYSALGVLNDLCAIQIHALTHSQRGACIVTIDYGDVTPPYVKGKGKFSHTRYRA